MKNKPIVLMARYYRKPEDPKKTSVAGYMRDHANLKFEEQVHVQAGYKPRDLQDQDIIIDITNEKVVKSNNLEWDFGRYFAYFYENYRDYINETVSLLHEAQNSE